MIHSPYWAENAVLFVFGNPLGLKILGNLLENKVYFGYTIIVLCLSQLILEYPLNNIEPGARII
jgi:hypothetical protein